jgi:tetratricopeptide (TPR) repeat protein
MPSIRLRRWRSPLTLLALVLALSLSCTTDPWERNECANADGDLAAYLAQLDEARQDKEGVEEARWNIQQLAVRCPAHVPTKMANAVLSYEDGNRALAVQFLDGLFSLEPSHPEAAILRGRIALDDGNLRFARKLFDQQIRYRPDHAGLRESFAGVLYLLGEYEPARQALDSAGRLGAPPWRIAYHLGLVEEAEGNKAAAARYYQDCLEENPSFGPARSRLIGLEGRKSESQ